MSTRPIGVLDQQAAHAELNAIPLVGGHPPLPERLGDDAEHRAAVELLTAGLNARACASVRAVRVSTRGCRNHALSLVVASRVVSSTGRGRPALASALLPTAVRARTARARRRIVAAAIARVVEQPQEARAPSRARRRRRDAARGSRFRSRRATASRLRRAKLRQRAAARAARCTSVVRSSGRPRRALDLRRRRSASRSAALCATNTCPSSDAEQLVADLGEASARRAPSPHVMFVSAVTIGGIGRSGLTSVSKTVVDDAVAHEDDGDLGDAVAAIRARARRLDVDHDERCVVELRPARRHVRAAALRGAGHVAASTDASRSVHRPSDVARESLVPGEQRRRHVLGDHRRRAGKLADVRDERLRIRRPGGEVSRRALGEQRSSAECRARWALSSTGRPRHRTASCSAVRRRRAPARPPRT